MENKVKTNQTHISLATERAEGGVSVLGVHGELDIATAPELRSALNELIDGGTHRVVVDLLEVGFIDSTALAVLLQAHRRVEESGGLAVVIDPASYTHLIFEIAGLGHRLALLDSRAAAIAHLNA
jgi:anti-sigma B factor antagonist